MSNKPLVVMPKKLTDTLDAYFQTSKFAQKNFVPFNKELLHAKIREVAGRFNYEVVGLEEGKDFKGVFKLERKSQKLRVSAKTLPFAEKWD